MLGEMGHGRFKNFKSQLRTEHATGALLLLIAIALIALPEMPEGAKSCALAAFACAALLQGADHR